MRRRLLVGGLMVLVMVATCAVGFFASGDDTEDEAPSSANLDFEDCAGELPEKAQQPDDAAVCL